MPREGSRVISSRTELAAHRRLCRSCGAYRCFVAGAVIAFATAHAPRCQAQLQILGSSINLTNFVNTGEDLIVGDKEFTEFSISGSFQASQVYVTPIEEAGNYGIRFSGAFAASGSAEDMSLTYAVNVTNSANLISAANLLFNGQVTFGTGLAQIVEQVFTNNDFAVPAGQLQVFASIASNKYADSVSITPPQPFLDLSKDVLLYAQVPAFATISTIDQTFTQVPEPSAVALLAAGLAALFLLRSRRSD